MVNMLKLRALLKEQKGAAIVITAAAMTAFIGMTAAVIDLGTLYYTRAQLSNMADSAVLAGAQNLPYDTAQAVAAATSYAQQNGQSGDSITAALSDSNSTITVSVARNVPLLFAKILNMTSSNVGATAQASNQVVTGGTGMVPLAIEQQSFNYGQLYTLKQGGGSGSNGNYGALALGGSGASTYRNNLKYGYSGHLSVGQWIDTEPGNMSGPTSDGINYRIGLDPCATYQTVQKNSGRIIIVPIVDSLSVNGRKSVQIVGFAAFFLEGVGGSGNKNYVTGRFLKMYYPGDTSSATATDFGLRSIKLVQ